MFLSAYVYIFMQSMDEGQDVDQRASQARTSLIFSTVALVFGLLATIAVVVVSIIYVEKIRNEPDSYN